MPYVKYDWSTGDLISAARLDNLETQYDSAVQQPRCAVYHTSNQTISSTTAALAWNSEDNDSHSMHDTATNNTRITIPSGWGGRYLINVSVAWESFSGENHLRVRKNGSTYLAVNSQNPDGTYSNFQTITAEAILSASDYIEIMADQHSGSDKTLYSRANSYHNMYFSVSRIGDT